MGTVVDEDERALRRNRCRAWVAGGLSILLGDALLWRGGMPLWYIGAIATLGVAYLIIGAFAKVGRW